MKQIIVAWFNIPGHFLPKSLIMLFVNTLKLFYNKVMMYIRKKD